MPALKKFHVELAKVIKPYGLYLCKGPGGGGHFAIRNAAGKRVGTVAGSPRDHGGYVVENCVKQLILKGAVPPETIRQVKR